MRGKKQMKDFLKLSKYLKINYNYSLVKKSNDAVLYAYVTVQNQKVDETQRNDVF